jgi:hypothetical protein
MSCHVVLPRRLVGRVCSRLGRDMPAAKCECSTSNTRKSRPVLHRPQTLGLVRDREAAAMLRQAVGLSRGKRGSGGGGTAVRRAYPSATLRAGRCPPSGGCATASDGDRHDDVAPTARQRLWSCLCGAAMRRSFGEGGRPPAMWGHLPHRVGATLCGRPPPAEACWAEAGASATSIPPRSAMPRAGIPRPFTPCCPSERL